jgi:hypothetical protein
MNSRATLALSNHRPESVIPAQRLMARHDAVILEEPPDDHFQKMLSGELGIEAYLRELDLEYPEFGIRMSEVLQEFHASGKNLYQIEPFLEKLLEIHEFFAEGGRPDDLKKGTDLYKVYDAERMATAALLDFYKVSVSGAFEKSVDAVKRFARADAERFLLRDRMRADAIVAVLDRPGSYYVEAGQIHYFLWRELKRRLPPNYPLNIRFLMSEAVREMGYRGHLYGPGDLLTLIYIFHPKRNDRREDVLAARALIYSKVIAKEEILESADPYPHTRDELETNAMVGNLTLEDCGRLFPSICRASSETARERVRKYLSRK